MNKPLKIVSWLLVIASIVLIGIIGLTIYIKTSHRMEYRQAEPVALTYTPREITYTREEVRKKIENLAGKQLIFLCRERPIFKQENIWRNSILNKAYYYARQF